MSTLRIVCVALIAVSVVAFVVRGAHADSGTRGATAGAPVSDVSAGNGKAVALELEPTLDEYGRLFEAALLRPEWNRRVAAARQNLIEGRSRYEAVAQRTGVPWFVIGILNIAENRGRFDGHLHNGDPLTDRTVRMPRGRPKEGIPPFTWEQSAEDAIRLEKLSEKKIWALEDTLLVFERYNGFGHRGRVPSPYLWSGSNLYEKGGFVRDGRFDANYVYKRVGTAVLLKYAIPRQELERTLKYRQAP
jgi:lysozyme family protein